MLNSVRGKIIVPVMAVLFVLLLTIILFVSISTTNLADDLTLERVNGMSNVATSWMDNFLQESRVISLSTSRSEAVIASLQRWQSDPDLSRQELIAYLDAAARDMRVTSFVVHDAQGYVVLRLHDINNYADLDSHLPFVSAAMRGESSLGYASTGTMPMGVIATTPIYDANNVNIGSISALFFLHTNEFVDDLSRIFNAEVTIFGGPDGNMRIATTIKDETNQRNLGTPLDTQEVLDQVLGRGESLVTELQLYGQSYHAVYFPLRGTNGNVIGMFFVGFSDENTVASVSSLIITLIIIGFVVLLIAALVVLRVAGTISKPLTVLTDFMKQAASTGDISLRKEDIAVIQQLSQRKDELGQCIGSTATFVQSINEEMNLLERIADGDLTIEPHVLSERDKVGKSLTRVVDNLNRMFGEIQASTTQVAAGSKQIADGSQALAQGSTQQAASVQQLSASISDIATNTKVNAEKAEHAAMLASEIKISAEKGSNQMSEMMTAVKDINASSHNISKVIKSIDDIAFQTNILALNAAVEAARAGQHGKGFAVVAEEVRNLAAKSAEAAKDTESLIADSIAKAELGSRIADSTAASLTEIVSGIAESTRIVNEIAESSEAQSAGISQINSGIDQVAQVIQQNSATAEESAAASQEMSGQSTILEDLISHFKLKDGDGSARRLPVRVQSHIKPAASAGDGVSRSFGKY